ncbi:Helix-hairpin-helix motif protein [uncultured archaeon]|nr:Helix-hairpin-helix motif protein [uncultured archaeon]
MNKIGSVLILIFLLSNISASCNSTQIDINSASPEDLDKLSGIGTVKAQAIIQGRPYNSIEDLIKVKGIGNSTLNKIKLQGLACVGEGISNRGIIQNDSEQINPIENISVTYEITAENTDLATSNIEDNPDKNAETTNLTPIILDAKTIKIENNSEILKRNLPFYGLIAICIIFGALVLLKGRKRKNEFN